MVGMKRTNDAEPQVLSPLAQAIGKRHPFELAEEELYVNLLRTVDQLSQRVTKLLGQYDLSESLYNSLRITAGERHSYPDGIPVGLISQRLVCRQPDTTRLVDRLESLGYVERNACELDARRRLIRATDAGLAILKQLQKPLANIHREQFGGLTERKVKSLNSVLDLIRSSMSQEG